MFDLYRSTKKTLLLKDNNRHPSQFFLPSRTIVKNHRRSFYTLFGGNQLVMRHTNRVEPVNTDTHELPRAVMITTTQLEIIRRVEVIPISPVDQPYVTASIK